MNKDFCPYYSSKNVFNAECAQRMLTGHIYISKQNQHWEEILTDPDAGTDIDKFGIHQNSDSFSL